MEGLVGSFLQPFQNIITRLSTCKKRRSSQLENDGQGMLFAIRKPSFYKRSPSLHKSPTPNKHFPSHSDYDLKRFKLSITESKFLEMKSEPVLIDLRETKSKSKTMSKGKDSKHGKIEGKYDIFENFKLTKALNQVHQQKTIYPQMDSPSKNVSYGSQENPIIMEEDHEEEKKVNNYQKKNTEDLVKAFESAVDEFSMISFESLNIQSEDEMKFEERKETRKITKIQKYEYFEAVVDEDYQNNIGDMLNEKVMDDKRNFPRLSPEQYHNIKRIWSYKGNMTQNVAQHAHIVQPLSYKNILTLSGTNWLNDEVINAYLSLINKRDNETLKNKVYAFNTFFYTKLESCFKDNNFTPVFRIAERAKVEMREYNKLIFPLNLNNNHWGFVCADLVKKTITYNDSMYKSASKADGILSNFKTFLEKAIQHEKSKKHDAQDNIPNGFESWKLYKNENFPQQSNHCDCGVFTLKGIDYVSRGLVPSFSADDMPYFRLLITQELIEGKLLTPNSL